jgi:glucose-6-phosphate 1-dehydrogenase
MSAPEPSDALVFFGATGDLAYKQFFPALQALVRRGALNDEADRLVAAIQGGWRKPVDPARAPAARRQS